MVISRLTASAAYERACVCDLFKPFKTKIVVNFSFQHGVYGYMEMYISTLWGWACRSNLDFFFFPMRRFLDVYWLFYRLCHEVALFGWQHVDIHLQCSSGFFKHTLICTNTHMHTHMHTCMHAHVHLPTHMHLYAHTHMYAHAITISSVVVSF